MTIRTLLCLDYGLTQIYKHKLEQLYTLDLHLPTFFFLNYFCSVYTFNDFHKLYYKMVHKLDESII